MNFIKILIYYYLPINKKNYIKISKELKYHTGWFFTNQYTKDLYTWMIKKYGNNLNFCNDEGEILRTMDPNSYFKFIEYYDYIEFNQCV